MSPPLLRQKTLEKYSATAKNPDDLYLPAYQLQDYIVAEIDTDTNYEPEVRFQVTLEELFFYMRYAVEPSFRQVSADLFYIKAAEQNLTIPQAKIIGRRRIAILETKQKKMTSISIYNKTPERERRLIEEAVKFRKNLKAAFEKRTKTVIMYRPKPSEPSMSATAVCRLLGITPMKLFMIDHTHQPPNGRRHYTAAEVEELKKTILTQQPPSLKTADK